MSSIGAPPPGLDPSRLDLSGQVALDQARQQERLRAESAPALAPALAPEPAATPGVDPGEAILALSAWEGVEGPRLLEDATALGAQLAALDRAEAASAGVDAVLASL